MQGNGKAAESLDALPFQMQMKMRFWPRSAQQPNAALILMRIPSAKTKTTNKRLHDGIKKQQLFEIL
jgi:hypothetical protein